MQSKMASENSVFYEKLAEEVRSYTCLYDKSSDDFKSTNKTRPVSVYTFFFFVCGAANSSRRISSLSVILKTWLVSYSSGFIHELIGLAYASYLVLIEQA